MKIFILCCSRVFFHRGGYEIGINNCAVPGNSFKGVFDTYIYESLQKDYPLVIYGFVLNDFGKGDIDEIVGYSFIDFHNGGYEFDSKRMLSRAYNLICYVIDKRRLHNVTLRGYLEEFKDGKAQYNFGKLRRLNKIIRDRNGELVVVIFPFLYDFDRYPFAQVHKKISDFCKSEGIYSLDLFPAFSKYKESQLWANPTDHHPNEIAHRIAAEQLYRFLIEEGLAEKITTQSKFADGHQTVSLKN
ncbi:MAG: hypothetical protein JW734_08595 [Candidatus Omnitrophica bacterium]|nr:hypothetical protein [Candidatus Omnitrophota bacterium]